MLVPVPELTPYVVVESRRVRRADRGHARIEVGALAPRVLVDALEPSVEPADGSVLRPQQLLGKAHDLDA
jgi:hypothetical protein